MGKLAFGITEASGIVNIIFFPALHPALMDLSTKSQARICG